MTEQVHALSADGGQLALPAIVVHGGAGRFDRVTTEARVERIAGGLTGALDAGWAAFAAGGSALDAVVEAVAYLEDSGRFNAGRGSVTTADGTIEFDASVMDAMTGRVGAICASTWPANPVRVARRVAEIGGPPDGPTLLAGAGADVFARDHGFAQMTAALLAAATAETEDGASTSSEVGTVGAVAVDAGGRIAAATSTGGRSGQMLGRVGDSPIPGAGIWAAPDTAAVSATGAGEAFVVAGFSHRIDWEMSAGVDLGEAVARALAVVAALGGTGGGIAITADGRFSASFNSAAMARGWRDAGGTVVRLFPVGTAGPD